MLKNFRIFILLFILVNVALTSWLTTTRTTSWDQPLEVVVYAIDGDGSDASRAYIAALNARDFEAIEAFFADIEKFYAREARRYGLALDLPVNIEYAGERTAQPPQPPGQGSTLAVMLWSLKLRFWAWWQDDYRYPQDVEIFVRYFDPVLTTTVAHSMGLQKGHIGVVNAFASKRMKKENHVVIAHELLHTLGASDKYDPATNQPLFPNGYGDPEQQPLYPQSRAELMAGRRAVTDRQAEPPRQLTEVVIGPATAQEINWLRTE